MADEPIKDTKQKTENLPAKASEKPQEEKAESKKEEKPETIEAPRKTASQSRGKRKGTEGAEKPKKVKLNKKLQDLMDEIEKLSLLELADLVKALEEKFGAPQVVPAVSGAPSGQAAPAEAGEEVTGGVEQTTFNVVLASAGANKISVIKAVREINQTLGLKDAKDLVESCPKEVLTAVNKTTAEEAKKKLEAAGATVELK